MGTGGQWWDPPGKIITHHEERIVTVGTGIQWCMIISHVGNGQREPTGQTTLPML